MVRRKTHIILLQLITARRLIFAALLCVLIQALPARSGWDFDKLVKMAQQRYGANASKLMSETQQLLASSKTLAEPDKLKRVNEFFNRRFQFQDDMTIWQQADYWASPLEMVGKGAGDCEDFAIIKYFALKELGVAAEKLRMSYVKAKIGGASSTVTQAHMVLTYYPTPDAEPLILDNLITDIRPASRRADLVPVFSFNSEGIFAGSGNQPSGSIDRLSRWKDVLLRMQADGIEF
ncbi:transglutaminase-like cysteine peptidase [Chitinibacter bivalviorum]|uniref:Transglutaminase-like cysteine peptidase n=1 Tax=Chitinibacter bivalviorum TaxID=2739434 RepID=A0A7H9BFH1_9NEIS|nr:transglutaminase-like cysteine peptidase [Chitinibacter bivalviorum]QLG87453.1 transglutaminase-like cysteine peptidase [Chitinibacter bivalviorum]